LPKDSRDPAAPPRPREDRFYRGEDMIPKIIHFVYGLEPDFGGKEFSFAHWAAIKSAKKLHPDFRILFWHRYLPSNHYFSDIQDSIELMPIQPPESIFGNPLCHVAHKTDVVRLMVLLEYGGIYLDMDTITVRPLVPLLNHKCVMGYEEIDGAPHGLCNAVMLAEPGSKFLQAWFENFRSFRSKGRDEYWAEHAVLVPLKLAPTMPDEITLLPKEAFFYPDWTEAGLQQMFYLNECFEQAFVHHLWESLSWGALRSINESSTKHLDCTYTAILNRVLGEEIEALAARRQDWVQRELKQRRAKLNLGCGPNRDISHVNCDLFAQTGADLVFDITSAHWPLPSDSVRSVMLSHVLEHLPSSNLDNFFRELHRVTHDGAEIRIKVPHPRHDWFLIDPTHVRAWHEESFAFLDKSVCLKWYLSGDSKTPLALYWNIDFKVENVVLLKESSETDRRLAKAFGPSNIDEMRPFVNNYAAEIQVTLRTRKSTARSGSNGVSEPINRALAT
jgi:mannosyltransferase OCH1-like enzyme